MELTSQSIYTRYQLNTKELINTNESKSFSNLISDTNDSIEINKEEKKTSSSSSWKDVHDDSFYKNAPEFKAFIKKWMDKGYSDIIAVERAEFYAQAGLLNYGDQTLTEVEYLGYGDKKQHGLHLINNDTLKNAMIETFDSLNNQGVGVLVERLFMNDGYINTDDNKNHESIVFQDLIDKFSFKFNNLNDKRNNIKFDGNINTPGQMNEEDKNFINDFIIKYLKDHINQITRIEEKYAEPWNEAKDTLNQLLDNFEGKVKSNNENHKVLNEYTKNNRPNIFLNN